MKDKIWSTKDLLAKIEAATIFVDESTDPKVGLQPRFFGPSRDELLTPSEFPLERFTSLLALDLLDGKVGAEISSKWRHCIGPCPTSSSPTVNYFYKNNTYILPDDIETTALFYLANIKSAPKQSMLEVAKRMTENILPDSGIIQTYFPPRGQHQRIDEFAMSNCLRFLYTIGKDAGAIQSENALLFHLTSKRYLRGTRYYEAPEAFLYSVSRAVGVSERAKSRFIGPLVEAIVSRLGTTFYALDAATRILSLHYLGVLSEAKYELKQFLDADLKTLMITQMSDGGWGADSLFKLGTVPVYLGGRETPSIFALAAMKAYAKCFNFC